MNLSDIEKFARKTQLHNMNQGCNARNVNCGRVYSETSSLWAEFVNNNSVRLVSKEVKSIKF